MTFHRFQPKSLQVDTGAGQEHLLSVALKEREGNVAVFETEIALPVGAPVEMLSSEGPIAGRVLRCRPLPNSEKAVELSVEFSTTS